MARLTSLARQGSRSSGSARRVPARVRARPQERPARPGRVATTSPQNWLWRHRRGLFLVWLFMFFAIAGAAFLLSRVPLPASASPPQTTFIYDTTGKQLAALDSGQNRVSVHLSQVPPVVINAVLSTEDHNFYHHGGVDPLGVVRAFFADLRGRGNLQGGSTITEQYVKVVYTGRQRTFIRKIKDAALAIRLERKLTKNQILERYLNTIYWGRGAYGIQAAARAYFGVDVGQLDLAQAALLAGLIRSPGSLNLASHNQTIATQRRSLTLKAMVRDHHITEGERIQAEEASLGVQPAKDAQLTVADSAHGTQYFIDYVRQTLTQHFHGSDVVLKGGLRVTTTLDLPMQDRAYDAVYGKGGLRDGEPAGALVAVDNQGHVRAMVGGKDHAASQVNLAAGAGGGGTGRQPGSTFKPFLLAETVKEGYSVESTFPAPAKVVLRGQGKNGQDYEVNNFNNEDGGASVNLIDATAHSLNTVYAQLEAAIGPDKLATVARQMGITSPLAPNASLVLGTSEVSVLDMAGAYSTFADGGTHIEPQVIAKLTTADGTPLPWPAPKVTPVLTTAQNSVVTYCLQQVVLRGTGTAAAFGSPVAGKTGTTSNFTDAWFIGFTPKLTAAIWLGYPQGSVSMTELRGVSGGVDGGSIPAQLFSHFMAETTKDGSYTGSFAPVYRFPGTTLTPPSTGISYPVGTGSTTTTSSSTTTTSSSTTTTTLQHPTSSQPSPSTTPSSTPPTTPPTSPPSTTTSSTRPP